MAKTTPSGRAKSKTKAPKKKPTQLDRIERSIGLIESKLATLNAWETLNEAMSKDKLASPTVAVEEIKPKELKVGEWVVCDLDHSNDHNHNPYWAEEMSDIVGRPLLVYGIIDGDVVAGVNDEHSGRWCWNMSWLRPATPAEIAAHEAKLKAEAQAAEDAKLVFGARVKVEHSEAEWLYLRAMQNDPTAHLLAHDDGTAVVFRQFFTLLP